MKLYTRSGDDGKTGLFGGGRVFKHDQRVDAYGHIDELNASIGWCACACDDEDGNQGLMKITLMAIQSRLLEVGADLATPHGSKHEGSIARLQLNAIEALERLIDEVDGGNEELTGFILPGGCELSGRLHMARTVCRRAERSAVALETNEEINHNVVVYLNRLSDLLFAMGRRANVICGTDEVGWVPPKVD